MSNLVYLFAVEFNVSANEDQTHYSIIMVKQTSLADINPMLRGTFNKYKNISINKIKQ